jgi:hypothetical protein
MIVYFILNASSTVAADHDIYYSESGTVYPKREVRCYEKISIHEISYSRTSGSWVTIWFAEAQTALDHDWWIPAESLNPFCSQAIESVNTESFAMNLSEMQSTWPISSILSRRNQLANVSLDTLESFNEKMPGTIHWCLANQTSSSNSPIRSVGCFIQQRSETIVERPQYHLENGTVRSPSRTQLAVREVAATLI